MANDKILDIVFGEKLASEIYVFGFIDQADIFDTSADRIVTAAPEPFVDEPAGDSGAAGVGGDTGVVGIAIAGGFEDGIGGKGVLIYPNNGGEVVGIVGFEPGGAGEAFVIFQVIIVGGDGDLGVDKDGTGECEKKERPEEARSKGKSFRAGKASEDVGVDNSEHNEGLVGELEHGIGALVGGDVDILQIDNFGDEEKGDAGYR